ncbi:MAG TPA: hypothetical protein VLA33_13015 [Gemmatimonadota bacterium]|nr:hypothetical protein [Gemmatimonadota bacterium]
MLAVAVMLLFLPVVIGGESFFGRDVTPFFYPMKRYLAAAVGSGRFPLWNSLVAGGEPFFATLQPGVVYPGSFILYLLPFPHSVDWLIILHFCFAGGGWILLLRHEGRSPPAAALGAVTFTLGGFFVSLGNFVNNLQTMAWAPWLLLAWWLYLDDGRPLRILPFVATCVVAFLGGEPQLLALVLGIAFAYGLLGLRSTPVTAARQVVTFAAAGILALLVAGVQLIPFVEYVANSVRTLQLDVSFSASRSQEPSGLIHLFIPPALGAGGLGFTTDYMGTRAVPWLLSLYTGVLATGWASLGFLVVRRRERVFWGVLIVLGLALALGAHTPAYRIAFEALPPLRVFRYPEKFAVPLALAVPLLAARGFDRWREHAAGLPRVPVWFAAAAATYLFVVAALVAWPEVLETFCGPSGDDTLFICGDPATGARLYAEVAMRLGLILASAAALLVLRRRGRLGIEFACWALVLLAALDLGLAHRSVNPSVSSEVYTTRPWAAEVLTPVIDRSHEFRFRATPVRAPMGQTVRVRGAADLSNLYLDFQAMGPNVGQMFGFQLQDGLQGVELKSVAMTHDAAIHTWSDDPVRFLRMMNVRYYGDATAGADSMHGLIALARHPELPIRLYEVPDPLPRAYVAEGWETVTDPSAALYRALQPDWPSRRVALEEMPDAAAADGRPAGRLVAATWEPERIRLIARSSEPAVLVLLDRWYPGWKATVNGEPARLLRANGVFRAVEIPAGQADVEFVYAPRSLAIGGWLSALGVVACLLLWGWLRRREGRSA